MYPSSAARPNAGKGVIFGVLDSGVWPEHPSFADQGNLAAPPPKADGTPRACDFGDNPLTPGGRRVRVQQQAHRRASRSSTPTLPNATGADEPYPTPPVTPTATARTPPSTAAGNVARRRRRSSASSAARSTASPRRVGRGLQGLRRRGLLRLRHRRPPSSRRSCDGVDVINFSISGGTDPFTDPVELAFLDAYAAGVFVAASAGNDGPGRRHGQPPRRRGSPRSPRRPRTREFASTLTLTAGSGDTFTVDGRVDHGRRRVAAAGRARRRRRRTTTPLCTHPAPAGHVHRQDRRLPARRQRPRREGLQRPAGRRGRHDPVQPDARRHGDRQPLAADGAPRPTAPRFLAFMAAPHGRHRARSRPAQKADGQGDVMAAFSSAGPAGDVHQAGHHRPRRADPGRPHPDPRERRRRARPASTSRRSPAPRCRRRTSPARRRCSRRCTPTGRPGQIKSALMTTAIHGRRQGGRRDARPTRSTSASGRVDLTVAGDAGLTFDATAAEHGRPRQRPVAAVDLNVPSINAPVMPGKLTTTRSPRT